MKRKIFLLILSVLMMTACGHDASDIITKISSESDNISDTYATKEYEAETEVTTETETSPTVTASVTFAEASPMPKEIDMSQYSENAVLLTGQDIFISTSYGYNDESRITSWLVFNEEQLVDLPESYHAILTDDYPEKYPLADYVYVIEQENYSSGGYSCEAGGLLIDGEKMFFVDTEDSRATEPEEPVPEVMTGFTYFAAVPSKYFDMNIQYAGWTVPNTNDYTQSPLYFTGAGYVDDAGLLEKLPLKNYSAENDEEFELLAAAVDNTDFSNILRGNGHAPSLDDCTLFVVVFDRESTDYANEIKTSMYTDGKVCLSFNITHSDHKTTGSGIVYAYIPKEFLNENSVSGWAKLTS